MYPHKYIGVFFDSSKKLIGVPCGQNQFGAVELDIFFTLEPGCSDDELEEFITTVLDACYSKEYMPDEPTAMQKYTGIKSPITAEKNHGFIAIDWLQAKDYTFYPMKPNKGNRGGYIGINGIVLNVPVSYEKGALALAFRHALKVAYEHTFWKPK